MVPAASESGMLRFGSFTSPAVNVMLFQASAENSEPTWATQKATSSPSAPAPAERAGTQEKPGRISAAPTRVHIDEKLAEIAAALRPKKIPRKIRAMRAKVLVKVKRFWMIFPSL